MDDDDPLVDCSGFEWDDGNAGKNWPTHAVADAEAESIFFNSPLVTVGDTKHSQREERRFALGVTGAGRRLFVVFTIRERGQQRSIRIISARDMTRREATRYGQAKAHS